MIASFNVALLRINYFWLKIIFSYNNFLTCVFLCVWGLNVISELTLLNLEWWDACKINFTETIYNILETDNANHCKDYCQWPRRYSEIDNDALYKMEKKIFLKAFSFVSFWAICKVISDYLNVIMLYLYHFISI